MPNAPAIPQQALSSTAAFLPGKRSANLRMKVGSMIDFA
jgi:hypothetical protein